jgi:mannose-6-phosphate isomerase-like protein (cupin superfamily)
MWRRRGDETLTVAVHPGVSLAIPPGTSFQFRATGATALEAVAVTMPPWPGKEEAEAAEGIWPATA